jgi:hypothetical protein
VLIYFPPSATTDTHLDPTKPLIERATENVPLQTRQANDDVAQPHCILQVIYTLQKACFAVFFHHRVKASVVYDRIHRAVRIKKKRAEDVAGPRRVKRD